MAVSQKKGVTKLQLINRLLVSFIVVAVIFTILFIWGIRPSDVYYAIIPSTASKGKPPNFLFAFYGEGDHKLRRPMDVLIRDNLAYVSDADADKIFIFDMDGKYKFSIGKPGKGNGELNFPYGLATDNNNNLYVSDMKNHRIVVFNQKGNFIRIFPAQEQGKSLLASPGGLTIDDNKLFVTDIMLQKVMVFNLKGKKLLEFGKPGQNAGEFRYPNGIATDNKGYIYVADSGNNRIQVYDKYGNFFRTFSGGVKDSAAIFASPRGLKVQGDKILFVVNSLSNQVWAGDTKGQIYYRFGEKGDENNFFNFPNGIDITYDRIYVTDSGNHGIKVYKF